jgi:hypothetical protein
MEELTMIERHVMDKSDRHWSLVVMLSAWLGVAAVQAGLTEPPIGLAVVAATGFVVSFAPLFMVLQAVWSGRVSESTLKLIGPPMGIGYVIPALLPGLLNSSGVSYLSVQMVFAAAAQVIGVFYWRRQLVVDVFAVAVGGVTGIAGFWLGWWNDVSPIGVSLLFFVYGFGVSTAAFTWIKTSSIDQVVPSE